jgi:dTDP-glucose 4,6-dehydratase
MQDQPLPVYGDGKQIRDWLYVRDHCKALLVLLKKGKEGEVYNICGGQELTNLEITRMILHHLNKPESLVQHVTDRPGHDRRYAVDGRKMQELGWQPEWKLESGLGATVEWYVAHHEWWEKIRSRQAEFRDFYAKHYGNIGQNSWQIRPH